MLHGADTKKLFSLKMLDRAGTKKALGRAGMKKLFLLKMLADFVIKKPF